jgi:hypothetical protein
MICTSIARHSVGGYNRGFSEHVRACGTVGICTNDPQFKSPSFRRRPESRQGSTLAWFQNRTGGAPATRSNRYFFGWFSALFQRFLSPLGECLFFACPKKRHQKKGHPSFRLFPALLIKISGRETRPSGLHRTQATAELRQSLPYFLFCLRYSARQIGDPERHYALSSLRLITWYHAQPLK